MGLQNENGQTLDRGCRSTKDWLTRKGFGVLLLPLGSRAMFGDICYHDGEAELLASKEQRAGTLLNSLQYTAHNELCSPNVNSADNEDLWLNGTMAFLL